MQNQITAQTHHPTVSAMSLLNNTGRDKECRPLSL